MSSSLAPIPEAHLPTCKVGQGADCCRYIVMAPDFACAKGSTLKTTIDAKVAAGSMTARGDNCPGIAALAEEATDGGE